MATMASFGTFDVTYALMNANVPSNQPTLGLDAAVTLMALHRMTSVFFASACKT